MYSKELLKGTLKPIILKLLSDTERMYGYEIVRAVKQMSGGKILIKEGSLYPLLHSLAKDGALETESIMIGKRVRKYYRLSQKGEVVTSETLSELHDFIKTIQLIIHPKDGEYVLKT
jgi:DNA-binding PadR family transcriptional regulator